MAVMVPVELTPKKPKSPAASLNVADPIIVFPLKTSATKSPARVVPTPFAANTSMPAADTPGLKPITIVSPSENVPRAVVAPLMVPAGKTTRPGMLLDGALLKEIPGSRLPVGKMLLLVALLKGAFWVAALVPEVAAFSKPSTGKPG